MPYPAPTLYPSLTNFPGIGSSHVVQGLLLEANPQGVQLVARYVGEPNVPGEVKRRRRSVYDAMRRLGTPVLVKHRYNDADVTSGVATKSPAFSDIYGQSHSYDKISHGVGYCSVELSDNEWYHLTTGHVIVSDTDPGSAYGQAPKYRGYGPGFIVWVIEPDTALDFFRLTPAGALIKVQSAQVVAPWFPDMNDNDLLINVTLDRVGSIIAADERFELKTSNPTSIRGFDRRGRRENDTDGGNRYVLNQAFEMALVPNIGHPIYDVEIDR